MYKIIDTTELPSGELQVSMMIDTEFKSFVKKVYNRKRCTNNLVKKFVIDCLEYYVKQ